MENRLIQQSDFHPWRFIWIHPKETVREALESNSKWPFVLAMLFGVTWMLDRMSNRNVGDVLPVLGIFLVALVAGAVIGLVGWLIVGSVYHGMARLFGGVGTWKETLLGVAWCSIPYVAKSVLWIPQLLIFGREMFTSQTPLIDSNIVFMALFYFFGLIELVFFVWYYVVLSHGMGEIHGFSAWKGFVSVVLPPVVLFALMFVIAGILYG